MISEWKNLLENEVESNLCWSSNKGFLNYEGKHIIFHSVDRTFLKIVNWLSKKEGIFCFLYPVYRFNLSLPICLELLYSYPNKESKNKVFLISRADRVFIQDYLKIRANDLRLYIYPFPIGIVKSDGSVRRKYLREGIKIDTSLPIRLLVSDSLEKLPNSDAKDIGAIVLDCRFLRFSDDIEELIEWRKINKIPVLIMIETNPYSPFFQKAMNLGIPLWLWTNEDIKEDYEKDKEVYDKEPEKFMTPFSSSIKEIKNKTEGFESKDYFVGNNKEVCNKIKELRKSYQELRSLSNTDLQRKIARKYLLIVKNIEHLSVPPSIFNEQKGYYLYTTAFPEQIENLKQLANIVQEENSFFASSLEKGLQCVEDLLEALEKENPKGKLVLEIVNEAIRQNKSLIILSKNLTHAEATNDYIKRKFGWSEHQLNEHKIKATTIKTLMQTESSDLCLVSGLPDWNSWGILRSAVGKRMVYLLYADEKNIFDYQLKKDQSYYQILTKSKNRANFISKVFGKEADFSEEKVERIKVEPARKTWSESLSLETNPIFETLIKEEILAEDEKDELILDEEDTSVARSGRGSVEAYKITFSDGKILFAHKNRSLRIVDRKNELKLKKPLELRKGDIMMVIDNSAVQTLTRHLFKMAEFHPELHHITLKYLAWIHLLNKHLKDSEMGFADLLMKMKEKGTEIKTASAIYCWSKELVFQMRNKQNIRIIGEIFNDDYLKNNVDDIYAAMGKLKSIHMRLIIALKKMAQKTALKATLSEEDEIIDEDLDLHLDQFKESVELKEVVSVEKAGMIEYFKLNKVESQ